MDATQSRYGDIANLDTIEKRGLRQSLGRALLSDGRIGHAPFREAPNELNPILERFLGDLVADITHAVSARHSAAAKPRK
jgi:hypothetical protein